MIPFRTALPALLLAALAVSACGRGHPGDNCLSDLDCAQGSCLEGICVSCRTAEDCDPGASCLDSWPGGYCALPCEYAAGAGDGVVNAGVPTCPRDDLVCAQFGEAGQMCLRGCRADTDCGSAYRCTEDGYCRPSCTDDTQCGSGRSCTPDGTCQAGTAAAGSPGAPCSNDVQCTTGVGSLCAREAEGWPGGTCLSSCADVDGGADACPAGTVCLVFDSTTDESWCLQACTGNFDCRPDYFCQPVDDTGFCMPRCNASSVSFCADEGLVCEPNSGSCVEASGGASSVETLDLGSVAVVRNREFGSFGFDVVGDVASFTVVVTADGGGLSVPYRIVAPSGREVFNVERMGTSEMRILAYNNGSFAVLYPNSPRLAVEPGRWRFTLYNEDGGGTARVRVLLKHGPGLINSGTIDINAFVVTDVFGANPGSDQRFQAMMTAFENSWASAGLSIGTLEVIPVTGSERTRWSTIDSVDGTGNEFRQMIGALSGRAPRPGLNFFFVDAIEAGQEGFVILGLAAGIPGIPVIPGTDTSGVAVSTVAIDPSFGLGGPTGVGTTMAHEGGHWLGLYHTTEQPGTLHDPLPDTLECPASRDTDRSGFVDARECAGRGAQYLMFWEADPNAKTVTPNQAYVMLRNPAVR